MPVVTEAATGVFPPVQPAGEPFVWRPFFEEYETPINQQQGAADLFLSKQKTLLRCRSRVSRFSSLTSLR